ncbi:MAG: hypothetical protein E6H93_03660 [Chloroflexi bacterium]|nr:MAG: hypothetical protein E6H93_03660 [Chloroflexota bacterium]
MRHRRNVRRAALAVGLLAIALLVVGVVEGDIAEDLTHLGGLVIGLLNRFGAAACLALLYIEESRAVGCGLIGDLGGRRPLAGGDPGELDRRRPGSQCLDLPRPVRRGHRGSRVYPGARMERVGRAPGCATMSR